MPHPTAKPSLLTLPAEQLRGWLAQHGQPGYRAAQIRRWLFERRAATVDDMTDLPKTLRAELAEAFDLFTTEVVKHQQSDDGTEKLLLELSDGQRTECVLLRDDRHHRTVCVSTQVGCAMGCVFCASGLDGLDRNLRDAEILEQILQLQHLLPADERLSHVVVMGMGESLANLDALLSALEIVTSDEGLGIGARRITISTVGLPAGIRRLARTDHPYHLAVSLHAPNDELRNRLVPTNRGTGIDAILAAADDYFDHTGRRVTYEYVLLADLNDHVEHAQQLAVLLKSRNALVNVIPYNAVSELPYHTPSPAVTERFVETLRHAGINVQVRYRKGEGIDAACGQLRRRAGAKRLEA